MVITRGLKRKQEAVNVKQEHQHGRFTTPPQQPSEAAIPTRKTKLDPLNQTTKASYDGSTNADKSISQGGNNMASNNLIDEVGESSSNCFFEREDLQKTTSLNLTEIAEQMVNDGFVEVDSFGPDTTFVSMKGYKVKLKYKTLLADILSKYGDIAANCYLRSVAFRSFCMDLLCEIIQKLMDTDFIAIKEADLEEMMGHVVDFERANIDIGWLKKRLNDIFDAKKAIQHFRFSGSAKHRQAEQKLQKMNTRLEVYTRELAIKEAELKDLQKKIYATERDIFAVEDEVKKVEKVISEFKTKLRHIVLLGSLVQGLI